MVAGAAARARPTATARRTRRRRRSPPGTGSWPTRRRRSRPRRSTRSARATRSGRRWARSPAARAVATRCASSASGRRCARTPRERGVRLIGDVPIYVAPGGADQRRHPSCSSTASWRACRRTRSPTKGQRWGNPIYDWPALQRRGYRWWVERFRAHVRAVRPRAHRPLPRLRRLLGGARAARRDARGGTWRRGPGRARRSTPPRRELRRAAAHRRGPRRHHARRCSALRDELGCPGMVVLQFAFDPDDPHGPHRLENHRAGRSVALHRHARQRHAARLVASRCRRTRRPRSRAAAASGRDEPWWDLDRGSACARRRGCDAPGPGRARARLRGADEHARARRRAVALALDARRADAPRRRGGCARLTEAAGRHAVTRRRRRPRRLDHLRAAASPRSACRRESWAQWLAEALDLPVPQARGRRRPRARRAARPRAAPARSLRRGLRVGRRQRHPLGRLGRRRLRARPGADLRRGRGGERAAAAVHDPDRPRPPERRPEAAGGRRDHPARGAPPRRGAVRPRVLQVRAHDVLPRTSESPSPPQSGNSANALQREPCSPSTKVLLACVSCRSFVDARTPRHP